MAGAPDAEVSDLTLLAEVADASVAAVLTARHANGEMYTSVGPILIAVNPFGALQPARPPRGHNKEDGLYSHAVAMQYATASDDGWEMPPHVFAVAARSMSRLSTAGTGEPQVVIVAGESGAGKTEACRQVMRFVCLRSARTTPLAHGTPPRPGRNQQPPPPPSPRSVANAKRTAALSDLLMRSSPLLESFGNATTGRNRNSSRFGKFMTLDIDRARFGVHAAEVTTYLLEKGRVAGHRGGADSNFHIFHYLLAGIEEGYRRTWALPSTAPAEDAFRYTRGTASTRHGGAKADAAGLSEVRAALTVACVPSEEVDMVLQLVAAILHLGNVEFAEHESTNTTRAVGFVPAHAPSSPSAPSQRQRVASSDESPSERSRASPNHVELAAQLFGVTPESLHGALVTKTVIAGRGGGSGRGSMHQQQLSVSQAEVSRDSLACAVYQRLFAWVVATINKAAVATAADITDQNKGPALQARMSLLDIYGFEVFATNEFAQLCINYTNEKLQQIFVERTLRAEQEEYAREGIPWEHVDYFDNAGVCELLEGPSPKAPSVYALLDEQCAFASGTADAWVRAMNSGLSSSAFLKVPKGDRATFTVVHYAGEVEYDERGFLEANRDTLNPDLVECMLSSRYPFICSLFEDAATVARSGKRPPSAGSQFRVQVQGLAKTLRSSAPHYIRCVKPNAQAAPLKFDTEMVLEQVRHLGIAENTRLRQGGYAMRMQFDAFRRRFGVLLPAASLADSSGAALQGMCRTICSKPRSPPQAWNGRPPPPAAPQLVEADGFRLGATKVFVRRATDVRALESARLARLNALVTALQAFFRSKVDRARFLAMRAGAIRIQATQRRVLAQRLALKRQNSIKLLQDLARVKQHRAYFLAWRRALRTMQRHTRLWLVRGRCRKNLPLMIKIQVRPLTHTPARPWCMRARARGSAHSRCVRAQRHDCAPPANSPASHAPSLPQACARKMAERRRYLAARGAIVRAQAGARAVLARYRFQRARLVLSRLCATQRARMSRRRYLTSRRATIRAQAIRRQGVATRHFNKQRAAVTRIAASARGHKARAAYKRERASIVHLQACVRRNAERRRYERVRLCLSRLAASRKAIVQRREYLAAHALCVWMQACLRRSLWVRRYRVLKKTISRVQANARMFLARRAYCRDYARVTGLQARVRGKHARRYAEHRRDCLKVFRCVARILLFAVRASWRRKELERRMEVEELRRLEHALQTRVRRLAHAWHKLCEKLRTEPVVRASVSMSQAVTIVDVTSSKAKACGLAGSCWAVATHHASLRDVLPKTFADDAVSMLVGFYDRIPHGPKGSRVCLCLNKAALDNLIGSVPPPTRPEPVPVTPRSTATAASARSPARSPAAVARSPAATPRRLRADEVAPEDARYLPLAAYKRTAKGAGAAWGESLGRDTTRAMVHRARVRRVTNGKLLSTPRASASAVLAPDLTRWTPPGAFTPQKADAAIPSPTSPTPLLWSRGRPRPL